jgi:hypothetical protein
VAQFPSNVDRSNPLRHKPQLATGGMRALRARVASCAFLLTVLSSPALAETGYPDEGWTVLTVARSGAWGLSTARTQGEAIAGALRQCQGRSVDHSDCGAELIAYKVGWALAYLCGDHRVMATAVEWEAVEAIVSERIAALAQIHGDLPSCRRLLTVDPVGAVSAAKTPSR